MDLLAFPQQRGDRLQLRADLAEADLITERLHTAAGPRAVSVGGAGIRTLWHNSYDGRPARTVALFAEHPGKGSHPATTAQLPDAARPLAQQITKHTWSEIYGVFPGPAGNRRHIQLYRTAE